MGYVTNKNFTLTYSIKKIIKSYDNNDCFLRIKLKNTKNYPGEILPSEINAYGNFLNACEGDIYESDAMFNENENGYYIKLFGINKLIVPNNKKELSKYISKHVHGISRDTINHLIDCIGLDIISKINANPEILSEYSGFKIGSKKYNALVTWCEYNNCFEELMLFIQNLNLPAKLASKIYSRYGSSSIIKIKENPYCIYTLGSIDFKQADILAKRFGQCEWSDKRRLYSGVLAYLEGQAQNKGNSCVPEELFYQEINSFFFSTKQFLLTDTDKNGLVCSDGFDRLQIDAAINYWVANNILVRTTIDSVKYIAKKSYYMIEKESSDIFKKFIKEKRSFSISDKDIKTWINENKYPLAEQQEKALIMAAQSKCSILTGGPGTGKTYTTNAIVNLFKTYHPDLTLKLLAPTGKASARMKEITGIDSQTIHSALKIKNENLSIDDTFVLDADIIIIDEVSMMDEKVFYLLLKHIKKNSVLLMIGDSNQLPSVGVGNVLYDLLAANIVPHVELNQIFRQGEGSDIAHNALIIKNADEENLNDLRINKGDFNFVDKKNESDIANEIVLQIKSRINKGQTMKDILCLSPIHSTPIGTNELNILLQSIFNPIKTKKDIYKINDIKCFKVNDRVIHLKNNSNLGVKNGDIGTIIEINKETISVDFDNRDELVVYTKSTIKELDLAYCLTVHKSQGSEAKTVIMPFSKSQSYMLTNQLIYTGITRAKKEFIGIGQLEALKEGTLRKQLEIRYTLLKTFLCTNE